MTGINAPFRSRTPDGYRRIRAGFVLLLLLTLLYAADCGAGELLHAEDNPINGLNTVFLGKFRELIDPVRAIGRRIFWSLLVISLTLNGIRLILTSGEFQAVIYTLVRHCLIGGFYLTLLENGAEIGSSIINSFTGIYDPLAAGKNHVIGPAEFGDLIFTINARLVTIYDTMVTDKWTGLFMFVLGILFLILSLAVSVDFLIVYLSAHFICIAGIMLLAFGTLQYTRDIAVNYMRLLLAVSLELMAMIVICNLGWTVISDELDALAARPLQVTHVDFEMLTTTALFLLIIVHRLPPMLSQAVMAGGSGAYGPSGLGSFTLSRVTGFLSGKK